MGADVCWFSTQAIVVFASGVSIYNKKRTHKQIHSWFKCMSVCGEWVISTILNVLTNFGSTLLTHTLYSFALLRALAHTLAHFLFRFNIFICAFHDGALVFVCKWQKNVSKFNAKIWLHSYCFLYMLFFIDGWHIIYGSFITKKFHNGQSKVNSSIFLKILKI